MNTPLLQRCLSMANLICSTDLARDIQAELEKQPQLDQRMVDHFTVEKKVYALGIDVDDDITQTLYYTKMGAHGIYQLYENEVAALWYNIGLALKSLAPTENTTLTTTNQE